MTDWDETGDGLARANEVVTLRRGELAERLCGHAPRMWDFVCACGRALANEADWADHVADEIDVNTQ